MGCAASSSTPLEQMDSEASFDVYTWRHLPRDQMGPPNRKLHEKHRVKLHLFLLEVSDQPQKFSEIVEQRCFGSSLGACTIRLWWSRASTRRVMPRSSIMPIGGRARCPPV
ncbi:unnamed protein product [Durusdinium trenchii]|uniref:Uncharacterized protein n=1 Tax=Durusdinium trenchii TaxID=1381693 RepID=A0ABP0KDX4_9DINO